MAIGSILLAVGKGLATAAKVAFNVGKIAIKGVTTAVKVGAKVTKKIVSSASKVVSTAADTARSTIEEAKPRRMNFDEGPRKIGVRQLHSDAPNNADTGISEIEYRNIDSISSVKKMNFVPENDKQE